MIIVTGITNDQFSFHITIQLTYNLNDKTFYGKHHLNLKDTEIRGTRRIVVQSAFQKIQFIW